MDILNEYKKYVNENVEYDLLLDNLLNFFDKVPDLVNDNFPAILLEAFYSGKDFFKVKYRETFTLDFSLYFSSENSFQDENDCCLEGIHLYLHYNVIGREEYGLLKEVDKLPESLNDVYQKDYKEFKEYSSNLLSSLKKYFLGLDIEKE